MDIGDDGANLIFHLILDVSSNMLRVLVVFEKKRLSIVGDFGGSDAWWASTIFMGFDFEGGV